MLHRLVRRRGSIEHVGVCIENEKLGQRVVHLEEQLRLERLHRYAPRSEKLTERIFNEAEQAAAEGEETDDVEAAPIADTGLPDAEKPEPKKRGRKPLPEDLPRERVEHDLPEDHKACPCCRNRMHRMGETVSWSRLSSGRGADTPGMDIILNSMFDMSVGPTWDELVLGSAAPRILGGGRQAADGSAVAREH